MPKQSKNPKTTVPTRLIKHDEKTIVMYAKDAPVEIRKDKKPRTFEKLSKMIERNPE
jgi:hypothetical protein